MSGKNKKDGNILSFLNKTSKKNDDILYSNDTDISNSIPMGTSETSTILNQISSEVMISETKNIINDLGTRISGPKQPNLQAFPLSTFKKQNRAFSSIYYNKYNWNEYSVKPNAVFCFNCRHFSTNTLDEKFDNINGVQNWKKINDKFSKHEKSISHLTSTTKLNAYKMTLQSENVHTQISTVHRIQIIILSLLHIKRDIIIDSEKVLNIFSLKDRMLSLS
ncbi:zinc finger MYM-type protein 5-like [Rhopalosiphum maidis]|uniref:zinc finger MYM-type protein 5-like n=1 Tax=Rhopalosiphum maidis TaxID=43146 RepID=UPI000F00DEC5|nr:zinc finger MYM-type protein 5-like [Rhopalosiphum maidis]